MPPPSAGPSRKRNSELSDADSESTELYSANSDDSDDEFTPVYSRKPKRRSMGASPASIASTVKPKQASMNYTVLFVPVSPSDNLRHLNRQTISRKLESLAPNEIKDVRVNPRKNVLAIDVIHQASLLALTRVTDFDGIKVRAHLPLNKDMVVGVIYDVDISIPCGDLAMLIKEVSDHSNIVQVSRLGNSRCVKIVFKGDILPSHVKVGHFRHVVRPFTPRPLQCRKCQKMGHVSGVCRNVAICPRCAEPHNAESCRATALKCTNCHGSHEASSRDCPLVKKEWSVMKQMVRDGSTHKEAADVVRNRQRRSRRRRRSKTTATQYGRTTRSPTPTDRQTSLKRQLPPLPPPPPPNASQLESRKDAEALKAAADVAWPSLPPLSTHKEPMQNAPRSASSSTDDCHDKNLQVLAVLRSLMTTMRTLLNGMTTPSAQCALQVLDSLEPVLASLF
ncbi:uncharacterized protein LOC119374771 [Rhipicephalus sanguineus]|uniref:uncharacterized protein LOC119374771 n=1 Tax=Rhipicephalus sanguineus TaxID=34632 RepID=UPI0020C41201|nr:uncharacterized protein LOC119374771 [Rhipicephalus sanguineus]XP_049276266.1 uncharacterized protein LOC119374771 [Rhipicephalus sanguineus]XP_049276268.1 uncharacterized protein LOC119374771 [Rhipicephalus sanguineus]